MKEMLGFCAHTNSGNFTLPSEAEMNIKGWDKLWVQDTSQIRRLLLRGWAPNLKNFPCSGGLGPSSRLVWDWWDPLPA